MAILQREQNFSSSTDLISRNLGGDKERLNPTRRREHVVVKSVREDVKKWRGRDFLVIVGGGGSGSCGSGGFKTRDGDDAVRTRRNYQFPRAIAAGCGILSHACAGGIRKLPVETFVVELSLFTCNDHLRVNGEHVRTFACVGMCGCMRASDVSTLITMPLSTYALPNFFLQQIHKR